MRKILPAVFVLGGLFVAPLLSGGAGVAYTDVLNVFSVNQRINAGLGINIAPPATGAISASGCFTESSRAACAGYWTDVSYSSGNFTVNAACVPAACSWAPTSGQQTTYKYMLVGKTMWLIVRLDGTTIVGAPTSLRVAVPGGYTINSTIDAMYLAQVNAVFQPGAWEAGAGRTSIWFYPTVGFTAWAASAVNNSILYSAFLEVQ